MGDRNLDCIAVVIIIIIFIILLKGIHIIHEVI